jgi:iron(III) transport system ATP-binding protein
VASTGRYLLDGVDVRDIDEDDLSDLRNSKIGFVFQSFNLVPRTSALANVELPLAYAGLPRAERRRRATRALRAVGVGDRLDHLPSELSGGQQQRVALARALAPRPELMLLDEPFSNLDVDMRERLSLEVRDILKREHATAILVTHDQHEAFNIADEIGIMTQGRIEQWDTPYRLYHEPASRFVADFIGQGVLLPGTVLDRETVRVELGILRGRITQDVPYGTAVDVLLRPDDILHDDSSPLQAQVVHKAFRGAQFLYTLQLAGGARVLSLVPSHHNHAVGEKIGIRLEIDHVVAFPRTTPSAL